MKEVKKSFWDFVVVSGSTILVIPLMAVSDGLQGRLLGPEAYGKVNLVYSAILTFFFIGINWVSSAVLRYGKEEFNNENHIRKTASGYFVLTLVSLFLLFAGFYPFKEAIFRFLEIDYEYALPVILFGVFVQLAKGFVFEALKVVRLIKTQTLLSRVAVKILLTLGMLIPLAGWIGISVNYVIGLILISDLVVTVWGFAAMKKSYLFPVVIDKSHLFKVFAFAFPLFFASWSTQVINYVDTYAIKYFLTLEDVGIYNVAYKIFMAAKSFIGVGVTSIAVPIILTTHAQGKHDKLAVYLKRIVPQGSLAGFIIASGIIVCSDFIIPFVYGTDYHEAIVPMKILTASLVFTMMSSLMNGFYLALNMTRQLAFWGIVAGLVNVAIDLLLTRPLGIIGPSIASFVIFSFPPLLFFRLTHQRTGVRRNLSLLYCALILPVLFINLLPINYFIRLGATVAIVCGTVFVSAFFNIFHPNDLDYLRGVNMPKVVFRQIEAVIRFFQRIAALHRK